MRDDYLVSVIIPVYNVEKYISECLDSVIAQIYTNLDIVIVDDGSLDGSGAICDKVAANDDRINVIHTENRGVAEARNCGLKAAKGDYITFVDPDDIVAPSFVADLLEACLENDCLISQCTHVRFDKTDELVHCNSFKPEYTIWSGREMCKKLYTSEGMDASVLWTKLYHKKVWDSITFPTGKIHEDFWAIYKVLYSTERIVCLNSVLYYYRKNHSSITGMKFYNDRFQYFEALEEQMNDYIAWNEEELYKMAISHYMYALMSYCYKIIKDAGNKRKDLIALLQIKMKNAIEECDKRKIQVKDKYRLFIRHPVMATLGAKMLKKLMK